MRISDWSSDVGSSDIGAVVDGHLIRLAVERELALGDAVGEPPHRAAEILGLVEILLEIVVAERDIGLVAVLVGQDHRLQRRAIGDHGRRSEEHTSELQSLMRITYAGFCLKKK